MKKGAIDYISKPFSTDDALKRVDRALQFNRTRNENLLLQAKLAEEQKKTEAILQGMADMLLAIDTGGRIMMMNRKAETVFGATGGQSSEKKVGECSEG